MLLFLAALSHEPLHERPGMLLQRIYSEYRDPNFSPFVHPERYFAPRLLKAIRKEERSAGPGYVGHLDFDPLCQCQDSSGFQAQVMNITATLRHTATARVRLHFGRRAKRRSSSLRLLLVDTRLGWRIADIESSDEPSLLKALETSNHRQPAKRR